MAMYCPKKIYRPLKAATELLAGIPSVVYGFFGLVVLVPMVREFGRTLKQMGIVEKAGDGKGLLTTSIILGMMILPTIIGTTESAIRAVPTHYYEGALALGATHERSIFTVVIPAAKSGVLAGICLLYTSHLEKHMWMQSMCAICMAEIFCVRESPLLWGWKNYRFPCSDCTEPVLHPEKHLLFLL